MSSTELMNAFNITAITTMVSSTEEVNHNPTVEPSISSDPIYPDDMLGFTAACAFIIAVLGSCGNLITILALLMCKKLRKRSTTLFVVNLAFVEMFFCITILPMSGAQYAFLQYTGEPLLSDRACMFFTITRYTMTQAQIQTVIAIALTRAIAVTCPQFFMKVDNPMVTGCYIAVIWVYSFSCRIPTALGVFGHYRFNISTMECDLGDDIPSKIARFILMFTDAIIPVLFVLILYIYIFIRVKLSSMRVSKASKIPRPSISDKEASPGLSGAGSHDGSRKLSNHTINNLRHMMRRESVRAVFSRKESTLSQTKSSTSRRDMKVARSIFIIFIIVVICSVPVVIVHIINKPSVMPKVFLGMHILYWVQYCLNMVVYVLLNKQYRDAFINLLARVLPSLKSENKIRFPWENQSETSKSQPNNVFNSLKRSKHSVKSERSELNTVQEASALLNNKSSATCKDADAKYNDKQIKNRLKNNLNDESSETTHCLTNETIQPV